MYIHTLRQRDAYAHKNFAYVDTLHIALVCLLYPAHIFVVFGRHALALGSTTWVEAKILCGDFEAVCV